MAKLLKIGTRGSLLARAQTELVVQELKNQWLRDFSEPLQVEVIPIKTSGDMLQSGSLAAFGGKGLFTKEIEEALLEKTIDVAVHSMKDVAVNIPEDLEFVCFLKREDPRDVFISKRGQAFLEVPKGSIIGTSSLRRKFFALLHRPDLEVVSFRGNVDTRLRKLNDGEVYGTFLAKAGLNRLGVKLEHYEVMETSFMLPAIAQGALGLECHRHNEELKRFLSRLNHKTTELCIKAERSFAKALGAGCQTPIAAFAESSGENEISMKAVVLGYEQGQIAKSESRSTLMDVEKMGMKLGKELKPVFERWVKKCTS